MTGQLTRKERAELRCRILNACAKAAGEIADLARLSDYTRNHLYGCDVLNAQLDMHYEFTQLHQDLYPDQTPSWLT